MGKRIIQQARGHGGPRYRVRKRAFRIKPRYPPLKILGKGKILKLINSGGHTAPLAKIQIGREIFFNLAHKGAYEGQEIEINGKMEQGNIAQLKDIPISSHVFNIETMPGDGGKFVRAGGISAILNSKAIGYVHVLMPSKKEIILDERCRATLGVVAGGGRVEKPFVKAGKKYWTMKAKGKLWPRTSAVAMNVVDHPFGSGRGKRITHGMKGKTAKRNAPPGAKVGLIRPRRTGRKK